MKPSPKYEKETEKASTNSLQSPVQEKNKNEGKN